MAVRYSKQEIRSLRQKRTIDILSLMVLASLLLSAAIFCKRHQDWVLANFPALTAAIYRNSPADAQEFNVPETAAPIFDIRTGIPEKLDVPKNAKALVINYAREANVGGDWKQLWKLSKK